MTKKRFQGLACFISGWLELPIDKNVTNQPVKMHQNRFSRISKLPNDKQNSFQYFQRLECFIFNLFKLPMDENLTQELAKMLENRFFDLLWFKIMGKILFNGFRDWCALYLTDWSFFWTENLHISLLKCGENFGYCLSFKTSRKILSCNLKSWCPSFLAYWSLPWAKVWHCNSRKRWKIDF